MRVGCLFPRAAPHSPRIFTALFGVRQSPAFLVAGRKPEAGSRKDFLRSRICSGSASVLGQSPILWT